LKTAADVRAKTNINQSKTKSSISDGSRSRERASPKKFYGRISDILAPVYSAENFISKFYMVLIIKLKNKFNTEKIFFIQINVYYKCFIN